jgi:Cu/Ag efflux pump CusA
MRRKIVLCNVVGRDIGGFVEEARRRIAAAVELPPGTHVTFGGQFEGQQRAMRQLGLPMGVVGLVAFVVLSSSFGSVWQSFLVLANVPTTLAGAIMGLLVVGETVNVSSMIGMVALFGICAQNDILLLGKIYDARREGRALRDAVLEGARVRFRPILRARGGCSVFDGIRPLAGRPAADLLVLLESWSSSRSGLRTMSPWWGTSVSERRRRVRAPGAAGREWIVAAHDPRR